MTATRAPASSSNATSSLVCAPAVGGHVGVPVGQVARSARCPARRGPVGGDRRAVLIVATKRPSGRVRSSTRRSSTSSPFARRTSRCGRGRPRSGSGRGPRSSPRSSKYAAKVCSPGGVEVPVRPERRYMSAGMWSRQKAIGCPTIAGLDPVVPGVRGRGVGVGPRPDDQQVRVGQAALPRTGLSPPAARRRRPRAGSGVRRRGPCRAARCRRPRRRPVRTGRSAG